jgi:hypothetical protein
MQGCHRGGLIGRDGATLNFLTMHDDSLAQESGLALGDTIK